MSQFNANTIESLLAMPLRAEKVGKAGAKQFYRIPVRIVFNSSQQCRTIAVKIVSVKAPNATAAANLVRDEWAHRPETEVYAYGPRGGKVYRYIGYESSIAAQMFSRPAPLLLSLDFEANV